MHHPFREDVGAIHANGAGNSFVRRLGALAARVGRGVASHGPTRKATLTLLLFWGTTGMATAASVQVNVNAEPKLCARFLADLRGDQITKMTMGQLCRYDFAERHAGSFYRQLGWQPVPGDPVALTMKIYDANIQPATNPGGIANLARDRASIMRYAQEQARHHALRVEIVPIMFDNIPASGSAPTKGYLLRSRGSYCGMADKMSDNPAGSTTAGRVLIAFFTDKKLRRPALDNGRNLFTKSFPVLIDGEVMIIGLWTNWLRNHGFDLTGRGPSYSADIETNVGVMLSASGTWMEAARPLCDYRIYVKNGVK